MAVIYDTTMSPGKLELLTVWLPTQPWYLGGGHEPELAKVGGFRLDDPQGEVGIEFMVVTDGSGDRAVTYQLPLTYRGGALAGADHGLIGTSEHGVLGRRWIYDGAHDPVLVAQLIAAIQGGADPQDQNVSNTPDPTVIGHAVSDGSLTAIGSSVAANGPSGTDLHVQTASTENGPLIVRIKRVLRPDGNVAPAGHAGQPCLSATWRLPDGTKVRGVLATARVSAAG